MNSSITAVWPPTGLALAALLLGGYRLLPGVLAGAFLANVTTDAPFGSACGIAIGNTLEALTGAYLISNAGFNPSLSRMRDVAVLVGYGAVLSTAVSATIGVLSLWAGGAISSGDLGSDWRVWWLGDMGGDLLVAPAVLVLALRVRLEIRSRAVWEEAAVFAALAVVTAFVLSVRGPITFVLFPPLFWIALRYGQTGAVVASLLVSGIGIYYTANGEGTFVTGSQDANLLRAQLFAGIAALTSLLVAAARTERKELEANMEIVRNAAAEEERGRWARDLHDGTLQGLSAIQIGLSLGASSGDPQALKRATNDAMDLVESEIGKLRAVITELRPATLDEFGTEASIVELAGAAPEHGIEIDLSLDLAFEQGRASTRLIPELEIAVYRIVQEALNNAYKHSGADHVVIQIREDEWTVQVSVEDDGSGFQPGTATDGFGLLGMQERTELLNGKLRVISRPGGGTVVSASFPVQNRSTDGAVP